MVLSLSFATCFADCDCTSLHIWTSRREREKSGFIFTFDTHKLYSLRALVASVVLASLDMVTKKMRMYHLTVSFNFAPTSFFRFLSLFTFRVSKCLCVCVHSMCALFLSPFVVVHLPLVVGTWLSSGRQLNPFPMTRPD